MPTKKRVTEEGLYQVGKAIYKVVRSQTSGKFYAKRLEWRETPSGKKRSVFLYAPGDMERIAPEDKMLAEQAEAFGKQFGSCVNCGRGLSRGESLRRGYGPKCALNEGWPYDQNAD